MIEKRVSPAPDIEVRAIVAENNAESTIIRGYAVVYESPSVDLGGFIEQVAPGAFSRTLGEGNKIDAYWNHNPGQPLASTRSGGLKLTSDDRGLAFELDSRRMDPMMLDAVRSGDAGVSFGFSVVKETWEDRNGDLPLRTLNDVNLFEVSLTVIPAYPATEASFRSLQEWRSSLEADREVIEPVIETIEEPASESEVTETPLPEAFNEIRLRLLKRWAAHRAPSDK